MASTMGQTVGRFLLALIFVGAGAGKLGEFDKTTGGPTTSYMAPRLEKAMSRVQAYTGYDVSVHLPKSVYPNLVLFSATMEALGGILFIMNLSIGGYMLAGFLVVVTPIMHAFWDEVPNSPAQQNEMIHFLKNLAILGGIVQFLCTTDGKSLQKKRKWD